MIISLRDRAFVFPCGNENESIAFDLRRFSELSGRNVITFLKLSVKIRFSPDTNVVENIGNRHIGRDEQGICRGKTYLIDILGDGLTRVLGKYSADISLIIRKIVQKSEDFLFGFF